MNKAKIQSIEIPVFAEKDQARIVASAEESEKVLARLSGELDSVTKRAGYLRKQLLEMAFSGQLVDQDPNDEPASVLLDRIKTERAAEKPATRRRTSRKAVSV